MSFETFRKLEKLRNIRKPSTFETFEKLRPSKNFENLRKTSKTFEKLRKTSKNFENLRKTSKPSKNFETFDLRKTSTFEKLRPSKNFETFEKLRKHSTLWAFIIRNSPKVHAQRRFARRLRALKMAIFLYFGVWPCYRWVEGHFWSKANQVMGLSFFQNFNLKILFFRHLSNVLLWKVSWILKWHKTSKKISKQMSKNFSGEKGKKIYLLFLERIDFVTFLENVPL